MSDVPGNVSDDILIRISGACGRITLNRPRAMNALSLEMCRSMQAALEEWAADPAVHFVVLDGAGERGLCAGGDVRAMHTAVTSGKPELAVDFFRCEYRLNYLIARYPKPYVALMEGLVMGGGVGVSAHGSHRVVTERSELAMPETAIGFVPDVGGTYLLGKIPDEFGVYLGLTGNRVGAGDAIACGLADLMVPSAELPALTEELEASADRPALEACLAKHAMKAAPDETVTQREWIRECFARNTVEEIFSALAQHANPEAHATLEELKTKSPTSLKVTLAALRWARESGDLADALRQEFCIVQVSTLGHEFVEGVRAALVDKDRNPQWQPGRLEDVTPEEVERYFAEAEHEPLDLA